MVRVVPKSNHGLREIVIVSQLTDAGGAQYKEFSLRSRQIEPRGGNHSKEMAAGENEDVSLGGAGPLDDSIGAGSNLGRRLTAGTAVAKELPAGVPLADFGKAQALILAVVPFDEVGIDRGDWLEPRELAGASGALERAGENACELESSQPLGQEPCALLTAFGKRQVGETGMLAGKAPSRFGVASQVEDGEGSAHGFHRDVWWDP